MNAISILTIIFAILTCIGVITSLLLNWRIGKVSAYWIISLSGAGILVLLNMTKADTIFGALISNSAINPIKILVFFVSMTILSIILDNLNFFNYVATKCAKLAGKSQVKLFVIFYCLVSVLTIFTSNDIVILAFVPFICYFCKNSNINPAPYVFSTFVAANTWSMFLIIGNPTNVYVASFAGIDFVSYLTKMALPTLASGVASLGILLLLFKKQLNQPIEKSSQDQEVTINKGLVVLNASLLLTCTILLAVASYINLEMWYIALGFAVVEIVINMTICFIKKTDLKYITNSLKRAPWEFVPFLISMFLIIMCLDVNNITNMIANLFAKGNSVILYGISSFLFANGMNNIPMTALFSSILSYGGFDVGGVYATIIGSNLGAMLTPVGALAGIMFVNILKEKQVDFSIKSFIKYGVVVAVASMVTAIGVLLLV